jgi:hypothetical protein
MNTVSKLLAATLFACLSFVAQNSHAAVVFTTAPIVAVEVDIVRIVTRPPDGTGFTPFYVITSVPFTSACLTGTSQNALNNKTWPVAYSDRPDFKIIRETLQLAYAMNKRVKIYSDKCVNLDNNTTDYVFPVIWAVEII